MTPRLAFSLQYLGARGRHRGFLIVRATASMVPRRPMGPLAPAPGAAPAPAEVVRPLLVGDVLLKAESLIPLVLRLATDVDTAADLGIPIDVDGFAVAHVTDDLPGRQRLLSVGGLRLVAGFGEEYSGGQKVSLRRVAP